MPDSTGPAMRIPHRVVAAAVVAAAIAAPLAGCGQKGPLYLRERPPPHVKPVQPDRYHPIPYPQGAPADAEADRAPEK